MLPNGDHPTDRIGARSRGLFDDRWSPEPLWICSLRHDDGARVVFGRDVLQTDIGTAVEASSAVPGFFRPVVIDGDRYVDGGAHSPTNLDVVAGLGFDLVIVSSPMSGTLEALTPRRRHPARWYHRMLLHREAALVRESGSPVLLFEPDGVTLHLIGDAPLDPTRNQQIIATTRDAVDHELRGGQHAAAHAARAIFAGLRQGAC
jgi:NTE family protein